MTAEDKYNLAMDIVKKHNVQDDKDTVISIAASIKEDRFFVEYAGEKIVLFISWSEEKFGDKKKVFLNNLWVEESYRKRNTLIRLRRLSKYLFKNIDGFYWLNLKKNKLINRR